MVGPLKKKPFFNFLGYSAYSYDVRHVVNVRFDIEPDIGYLVFRNLSLPREFYVKRYQNIEMQSNWLVTVLIGWASKIEGMESKISIFLIILIFPDNQNQR